MIHSHCLLYFNLQHCIIFNLPALTLDILRLKCMLFDEECHRDLKGSGACAHSPYTPAHVSTLRNNKAKTNSSKKKEEDINTNKGKCKLNFHHKVLASANYAIVFARNVPQWLFCRCCFVAQFKQTEWLVSLWLTFRFMFLKFHPPLVTFCCSENILIL